MERVTDTSLSGLDRLRAALAASPLPGAAPLLHQVDDYIAPRLANLDAPLLAVVGGSTGSGKSTLVNGVLHEEVTTSGVIRPTTRQPSLIAHPSDAEYFGASHVLPGLAREHGGANPQATTLRIVSTEAVPAGLALIDAPDFDSIDDTNRALASQLLAAADLWIFVTTPARYADHLVWQFLEDAAARDIKVVVVLNRVDEDALTTVPADLQRMLAEHNLGAEFFVVPDQGPLEGLLPAARTADLRAYLERLAADTAARRQLAARTVAGALAKVAAGTETLAAEQQSRTDFAALIDEVVAGHYADARAHVEEATRDGNLLRTEVLARWQDFVGTSDTFRAVDRWFSAARDRIGSFFTGKPAPVREVETEIEAGLHAVIVDGAETAAARAWTYLGSSAPELRAAASPELAHASADISVRAALLVREWQAELVADIEENAAGKRMTARLASLGVNAVTVALMVVVFASTAGLTGGEIAIAGGSAVVGQKLLETIFGEDTVRRMAKAARKRLDERVRALMDSESERYDAVTAPLAEGSSADELRAAATAATEEVRDV
nr:ABC transporter [Corynebacterium phoceense]